MTVAEARSAERGTAGKKMPSPRPSPYSFAAIPHSSSASASSSSSPSPSALAPRALRRHLHLLPRTPRRSGRQIRRCRPRPLRGGPRSIRRRPRKARAPAIHWTTPLPAGACPPWTKNCQLTGRPCLRPCPGNESKRRNQFSLTRAAYSTAARQKAISYQFISSVSFK